MKPVVASFYCVDFWELIFLAARIPETRKHLFH